MSDGLVHEKILCPDCGEVYCGQVCPQCGQTKEEARERARASKGGSTTEKQ